MATLSSGGASGRCLLGSLSLPPPQNQTMAIVINRGHGTGFERCSSPDCLETIKLVEKKKDDRKRGALKSIDASMEGKASE